MFCPVFLLESSTDILCLAYQGLRCHDSEDLLEVVINKDWQFDTTLIKSTM